MDFLQRGTEPENIQEQMIWNNRCAWQAMISALYLPLDEPFCPLPCLGADAGDGQRRRGLSSDRTAIPSPAMSDERYSVPSAISLPDRMREYYDFLRDGGVHPLIKSAVGQAYILVVRPFPEGNERLARMISSAVLLRSGYDLFRDISISGVIAPGELPLLQGHAGYPSWRERRGSHVLRGILFGASCPGAGGEKNAGTAQGGRGIGTGTPHGAGAVAKRSHRNACSKAQ